MMDPPGDHYGNTAVGHWTIYQCCGECKDLSFCIKKNSKVSYHTCIFTDPSIGGIDSGQWKLVRPNFNWSMTKVKEHDQVITINGLTRHIYHYTRKQSLDPSLSSGPKKRLSPKRWIQASYQCDMVYDQPYQGVTTLWGHLYFSLITSYQFSNQDHFWPMDPSLGPGVTGIFRKCLVTCHPPTSQTFWHVQLKTFFKNLTSPRGYSLWWRLGQKKLFWSNPCKMSG